MEDFIKKISDSTDPEGTAGTAGACDEGHGNGVCGKSKNAHGVYGHSSAKYHGGVTGINDNSSNEAGPGVLGKSRGVGVWGESETWNGVYGESKSTTGGAGVCGKSNTGCGVIAINSNPESMAAALYAKKEGVAMGYAAIFDGVVKIDHGFLMIGNKSLENLLDELEKRLEEKRLRLIYELEDQLNITLPKS